MEPETLIRFVTEVVNPRGEVVHNKFNDVAVAVSSDLTPRKSVVQQLLFEVTEVGIWAIRITSADTIFANHDIEFRLGKEA